MSFNKFYTAVIISYRQSHKTLANSVLVRLYSVDQMHFKYFPFQLFLFTLNLHYCKRFYDVKKRTKKKQQHITIITTNILR